MVDVHIADADRLIARAIERRPLSFRRPRICRGDDPSPRLVDVREARGQRDRLEGGTKGTIWRTHSEPPRSPPRSSTAG